MWRYNLTFRVRLIDQVYHFQIADSLPTKTVPKCGNAVHQTDTKTQSTKEKKRKDLSDSLGSLTAPSGSKKSRVTVKEDMEDNTDVRQESQSAPAPPVTGGNTGQIPKVRSISHALLAWLISFQDQHEDESHLPLL